jgi:folate-binding protein YgfZ
MAPSDPPALLFSLDETAATFEATGADRQSWLNGLVTCNLAPLKPGQGAYGLATSKVGKILADLDILLKDGAILVACPGPRRAALQESFDRYLVMEDVDLRDASEEFSWLRLHGAGAEEAAAALASALGGLSGGQDRTGLGDAILAVPAGRQGEAAEAVRRIAAPLREHDWLRIERGVPLFGVDFGESHYPQEATLEKRAVSFSKGCYLGQEVVCRLEMRGHVHRRLAVLRADGELVAGAPVTAGGAEVGAITSAAAHPEGGAVALAMLKYAHTEPGSAVEVGGGAATVREPRR